MFIREITNNIKQPIVENPFGWAALDLLFGTKSTAGPRHDEMGAGDILYRAIEGRVGAEQAENIAQDFETKMRNPATADRAWSQWEELTGQQRTDHFDYVAPSNPSPQAQTDAPKQPNAPDSDTAPQAPAADSTPNVTKTAPTMPTPASVKPATPSPSYDDAILRQQRAITAQAPNLVKDAGAAQAFAQSSPKSATDIAQGITSITKGAVAPTTVQQITQGAIKYGLPAAGIVALLYGGKKLFDYVSKRKKQKESLGEEMTPGGTGTSSISVVVNPKAAYSKPKKTGRYGAPQAPQRKNPDGTAKSALDVDDSLMGNGKVVKR